MTTPWLATGSAGQALDIESDAWIRRPSGTGRERDDAIKRLHALPARGPPEVGRRRPPVAVAGPDGVEDLAVQAADDALVAILTKLHTYRGDSRFTTWAYKFALLEAAAKLRRRPWHGRELPLEADGWAKLLDDTGASFLCSRGSL